MHVTGSTTLLQYDDGFACAGLTVDARGVIVEAAPILRQFVGQHASALAARGSLVEIAPHSVPSVSASQIETWRTCQRKWAYSRIRPRREDNRFAAFGTRVHRLLERWHTHREVPPSSTPEGRCALTLLPEAGQAGAAGIVVEHEMRMLFDGRTLCLITCFELAPNTWRADVEGTSIAGWGNDADAAGRDAATKAIALLGPAFVYYTGRIDLIDGYRPGEIVRVSDYKSCGDLVRADEMRADFEENPQRILYTAYTRARFRVPAAVSRWLYVERPTKTRTQPRYDVVEMIESENVIGRFQRLHRTDGLAIVRAHGRHPTDFPRTIASCYKYGGPCEHLAECWASMTALEQAAATMESRNKTMSNGPDIMSAIAASLQGAPNGQTAPAQPVQTQPIPAFAPPAPPAQPSDPTAGWDEQAKQALGELQAAAVGQRPYTFDQFATHLTEHGRGYVVEHARTLLSAQPQQAPAVTQPSAPTPGPAPKREKSYKRAQVETMLRAALGTPAPTDAATFEALIGRMLG